MLRSYQYTGVPKPFDHQVKTTEFIVNNPRCFVFNDIGTGKTWSAVWSSDYLQKVGEVRGVLIVAPLSTLQVVWQRTFFHLDASLDVEVLKGSAEKRLHLLGRPNRQKVSVINPDALHIIADSPAIKDYDLVIVDESAMFRNAKSRRVKALAKICRDASRVVMMTGSPCPEAPTDIWATARIVCPDRVPQYFGRFRDLTMKKITQFKYVPYDDAQETISKLLSGYVIRYRRDECIDLPESQHVDYELEPTKEQRELIKEIRSSSVAMLEDGKINAANEAVVLSKIMQIASGAVKYKDDEGNEQVLETDASNKFDALDEFLEASPQPLIVYAPFKAVIEPHL
jgi:SNF2 family DNA or RNA helicase